MTRYFGRRPLVLVNRALGIADQTKMSATRKGCRVVVVSKIKSGEWSFKVAVSLRRGRRSISGNVFMNESTSSRKVRVNGQM